MMDALVAIGALIAGGAISWWFGGRNEKAKEKLRVERRNKEAEEFRNEIENRIARDADAKRKLRSDWSE